MSEISKASKKLAYKIKLTSFFLIVLVSMTYSNKSISYTQTQGFIKGNGYVDTIGIPTPPFNISQNTPAIDEGLWKTPQEGLYYINTTSANASDSTNGTPSSPRKTLPSTIPPGSYIKIEGQYNIASAGYSFINANGNSDSWVQGVSGPVWLVGEGAVFTKGVVIQGSNLFIENIQFGLESGQGGRFLIGSSKPRYVKNIVIRNSIFYGIEATEGASGSALLVTGVNDTNPAENIVLYDNQFFNNGDVNAEYDQDFHMIQVDKGVNGYWFINNLIQFSSGSGIQVLGTTDSTKNIYIGSNTITNVRQAGVGIKYGSDIIISQNVMADIIDTRPLYATSPSPSKGVSYQYAPQNLWILFNDISNSSDGVYGGSTNDGDWNIYIIGNYIHDISSPEGVQMGGGAWADAAMMLQGGKYRYIVNNTIRNVNSGIYGPASNSLYNISENIISGVNIGNHIYIQSGNSANFNGNTDNKTYNENLLSLLDGITLDKKNHIIWASESTNLSSISDLNVCASDACFSSDSIFLTDTTELNQGGAKVLSQVNGHNRGIKHSVYNTFEELYGLSIEYDIYGVKRTPDWDIGASDNSDFREEEAPGGLKAPTIKSIILMQ